jgi:antitoxin (DNA-binding transcriptional repressor) of toxin-antitoxin stability system
MATVDVDEAVGKLRELISQAVAGGDVVIAKEDGTSVRLVPVAASGTPRFGSARGMIWMSDDFDAPLDDFAPYER